MARSRRYVVYLLVDPRDDRPYYVGSTSAPKVRFRQHCDPNSNPTLPVSHRTALILDSGEVPCFVVLEIHDQQINALVAELFWIDLLAHRDVPLVNTKGNRRWLLGRHDRVAQEQYRKAKSKRHGRRWSGEDWDRLEHYHELGLTEEEVATLLDRSPRAISQALARRKKDDDS